MTAMAVTYGKLPPARRAVMTALMVALLGLTVLGAWALQAPPARRVRAAARMLRKLRPEGHNQDWPEEVRIDWYLVRAGASSVGWTGVVTGRTLDGNCAGIRVEVRPDEEFRSVESWRLNPNATAGSYQAVTQLGRQHLRTRIDLKKGTVHVRSGGNKASAVAPANYMPEGTFDVLVRRVAAERADVQFKLVFNNRQNIPGEVRFDTLRMRYLGRKAKAGQPRLQAVRVSGVRTTRQYVATYQIDENGTVVRRSAEAVGLSWERCPLALVVKHFPGAAAELANALAELQPDLYLQLQRSGLQGLEGPVPEGIGPADEGRI